MCPDAGRLRFPAAECMGFAGQCMGLAGRRHTGCRDRRLDEEQRGGARVSGWARCRGRAWDALHSPVGRHDTESRHSAGVHRTVRRMRDGKAETDGAPTSAVRSYAALHCEGPVAAIRRVRHAARRQRGKRRTAERAERLTGEGQCGARRHVHEKGHERDHQRHRRAQARSVRLSCSVVLRTEAWRSVFLNRAACGTASYIDCGQSHCACPSVSVQSGRRRNRPLQSIRS